jgi:tRNA modification GTPase
VTASHQTHVVVLTPAGRAAIASVLVAGPQATSIVQQLFHSSRRLPLDVQPIDSILVGRWLSAAEGEEVVVARRAVDRCEIHCHGGRAAVEAVVGALVSQGCVELSWQAWLVHSEPDRIAADARIALADATTERTAAVLLDQALGALRRELDQIQSLLQQQNNEAAADRLGSLRDLARTGLHVIAPWQVVLVGRPNAGKSSLANALVGYQRAIVHATPGTTRDLVTTSIVLDGWPVEIVDTAGLCTSDDPLESAGVELALARGDSADLVLLVHDLGVPWTAEEQNWLTHWPRTLVVNNKADLPAAASTPACAPTAAQIVVSALRGDGLRELETAIVRLLVDPEPAPGQAVPFTAEQASALEQAQTLVLSDQGNQAATLLASGPFQLRR